MLVSEFDYELPAALVAQHPAPQRSASRLLHLQADGSIEDLAFPDFPRLVDARDALVLNDTRVIRARLRGRKKSGGRVELFIERILGTREALALIRASHAPGTGAELLVGGGGVAVKVEGRFFSVGHAGDSRVYLIRGGEIVQLTNDHSLVMEQMRRGLVTREEAERSTMQNVILRALGADESVEPDLADHELQVSDLLLLCSDGLTRKLSDNEILKIATGGSDLQRVCDSLIEAAKNAGSDDNISCILVRVSEKSLHDRLFGGGRESHRSA